MTVSLLYTMLIYEESCKEKAIVIYLALFVFLSTHTWFFSTWNLNKCGTFPVFFPSAGLDLSVRVVPTLSHACLCPLYLTDELELCSTVCMHEASLPDARVSFWA